MQLGLVSRALCSKLSQPPRAADQSLPRDGYGHDFHWKRGRGILKFARMMVRAPIQGEQRLLFIEGKGTEWDFLDGTLKRSIPRPSKAIKFHPTCLFLVVFRGINFKPDWRIQVCVLFIQKQDNYISSYIVYIQKNPCSSQLRHNDVVVIFAMLLGMRPYPGNFPIIILVIQ